MIWDGFGPDPGGFGPDPGVSARIRGVDLKYSWGLGAGSNIFLVWG